MEWEDIAGKERGDEMWCEWQQQSTEIKSSNREGDLGLWEKERGSQKTYSWDGEKAVTKRNLGTTGTCHAEVLSWGKEESLNQQFLINTYISRCQECKTEYFMLVLQDAINQGITS